MSFTPAAIKEKITEMYPEIDKHKIIMSVDFDAAKDAYIVKFKKDKHEIDHSRGEKGRRRLPA